MHNKNHKIFLQATCFLLAAFFFISLSAKAQLSDSLTTEISLKEKILNDIQVSLTKKNTTIDSTIATIDTRVDKIDSLIKSSTNAKDKVDKLLERVKVIEDKQSALEENEADIYEANYQSAMINLLSMEREIKPLVLFQAAKDFFNELSAVSNPATYPGYEEWFKGFYAYVEKNKDKDVTLDMVSNSLRLMSDVSVVTPMVGTASSMIFAGMSGYVNSLSNHDRAVKAESKKILILTMTVNEFAEDKDRIETEWDLITRSLEGLQNDYQKLLAKSLKDVNETKDNFEDSFTNENDDAKRYEYLTDIRKRAANQVLKLKAQYPEDWKERVYYQMADVQALKMQYGDLTLRIYEHIQKYNDLVKKYKKDKNIGDRVAILETKLANLTDTFDKTFEPQEYIHSVSRMYKVR